jgi:cell division protease FtsH
MVREFGLSRSLGPVGYPTGGSVFLGGGGAELSSRPFAEATQAAIDAEVAELLRQAEVTATEVLSQHRRQLDNLVDLLLEQETVDGADVYRLAGRSAPTEPGGATMAPRRVAAMDGGARHVAAGDEAGASGSKAGG